MSRESARHAQHGRQSVRKATEKPRGDEHFLRPWQQSIESQRPDPGRIPESHIIPGDTRREPPLRAERFLRDGVRNVAAVEVAPDP
jgi:hypothetical protein